MTQAPPAPAFDMEKAMANRKALTAEWEAAAPSTPEAILAFYAEAEHLAEDLDSFHEREFRKRFQAVLVHLVCTSGSRVVIDIGSGAGHDLAQLAALTEEEWPALDDDSKPRQIMGVEPNHNLREATAQVLGIPMFADVADAPIEDADIINCIDVVEHVYDPETWLGHIADRCKEGCTLIETCSTFDIDLPLHLESNRGWHPGRVLEAHGFERLAEENNLRVWIRASKDPVSRPTMCICAGREISGQTFDSVMSFVGEPGQRNWRISRAAENGLLRARSIWASKWWRETNSDVFLMIDSDIQFSPLDAEMVVQTAREKRSIAVGAYSVRDGGHLALRPFPVEGGRMAFGAAQPPIEIEYGATGFMAVHRDVLDAMIPTLPLCHSNQPWSLWPMFDFHVHPDPSAGGYNWLSEDWEFCRRARDLGFPTWLDPRIILMHYGVIPWTVLNMERVREAVHATPAAQIVDEHGQALTAGGSPNGRPDAAVNRAERRARKQRRNGKA